MALPAQPLEVSDFSGGITENILQGDPRRYAEADNFLITVDKKLTERPPLIPHGLNSYYLPGLFGERVNGAYTFINEKILFMQSGRSMFTITPGQDYWSEVTGIDGRSALQGGDAYSQTTYAEFQRQIYLTNDGLGQDRGIRPSKMYRDEENAWVVRTAGLPRSFVEGNYTEGTLLSKCIAVANDLRARFIEHFNDSQYGRFDVNNWTSPFTGTSSSFLHAFTDRTSLSYLVFQTFDPTIDPVDSIPSPVPTPAPNATNEASLFTLVRALCLAYAYHISDSKKGARGVVSTPSQPWFHQRIYIKYDYVAAVFNQPPKGPFASLENDGTPDSLEECAAQLDDLLQKWEWHRLSVFTHSPNNNYAQINKYATSSTKIQPIQIGNTYPTITPDFGDLYNYAINLNYLYETHFDIGQHTQVNNGVYGYDLSVAIPTPTDLDSLFLYVYWLRALYSEHIVDASVPTHLPITFSTTANSPNLSSVVDVSGAVTLPLGSYVVVQGGPFKALGGSYYSPFSPTVSNVARVISSGSGSAVLDRQAFATSGGVVGQASLSVYHLARTDDDSFTFATTTSDPGRVQDTLASTYSTIGGSTKEWLTLASEMFYALMSHFGTQAVHFFGYSALEVQVNFIAQTPTPFFIPTVSTLQYAFFFSDEYTVEPNGIDYLVRGNPVVTTSLELAYSYPVNYLIPSEDVDVYPSVVNIATRSNTIENLPVLANDSDTNYDVSRVKLNIYRTTDGGTTFYLLAQVPNGTTSYVDQISDSLSGQGEVALNTKEPIYTSGGVVGNDQPPISKFIHVLNGTTYYAAITELDQYFPQRLIQSVQYQPDSAPATFYLDLDDDITGITSTRNNLIALCSNSVFRVTGGFNELGQGSMTYEKISDTLGCLNAKSIVRTEIGVFFAGNDGFYYTDGYQIIKISLELDKTYLSLTQSPNQRRRIYGAYDKTTRRIHWAMQENETDSDNSVTYVFYLDYGVKPSGTFTTASNGLNYRPSSLVFQEGVMYMGHGAGAVLKTYENDKADFVVDMNTPVADWVTTHIPYDFTSLALDNGTIFKRKWSTRIHLVGKNTGNMSIQPYALRDLNQTGQGAIELAPINYLGNIWWGIPVCIWGDANAKWKYDGKMDLWRRFPRTTLRSDFMQIQFKPAFSAVYASSVDFPFGANAIVDDDGFGGKSAAIITPSDFTYIHWPSDVVGMKIAFQYDEYQAEYEITSIGAGGLNYILYFQDPDSTAINTPNGTEWVIRGYKKEQRVTLTSYVVHYAYLGDENQSYPGRFSNSGPGNGGENPS